MVNITASEQKRYGLTGTNQNRGFKGVQVNLTKSTVSRLAVRREVRGEFKDLKPN